jgi:hypothetical protein
MIPGVAGIAGIHGIGGTRWVMGGHADPMTTPGTGDGYEPTRLAGDSRRLMVMLFAQEPGMP